MSIGFVVGIPGMPDVGGALGPTPPDNARVTTSGAYRVTTDGAFRVWTAGAVLPDVESATRLLDIRTNALVLSEGNPASTWTNTGTVGGSFTQSGSARPTYRAGGGHPYLEFDGVDDSMTADAAINTALDNLPSFTVFVAYTNVFLDPDVNPSGDLISKGVDAFNSEGWSIYPYHSFYIAQDNSHYRGANGTFADDSPLTFVLAGEMISISELHLYVNGALDDHYIDAAGTMTTMTTLEPVRLGTSGDRLIPLAMQLYAIRIYAPAPDAGDRQAIIEDMAADTGITL